VAQPSGGVSGRALALISAGGVLVYAGLRHQSPLDALREIMSGNLTPVPAGSPVALKDFESLGGGDFSGAGNLAGGGLPALASQAQRYLGRPYQWAGTFTGPNPRGDCSGLVFRSFANLGIVAPRSSFGQMRWSKVRKISRGEVGAGDLTYWPGHIGIAINNDQGIYAPHTGTVVQIQNIDRPVTGLICLRYMGTGGGGGGGAKAQ
jgi:hypothetical protein